MGVNALIVLAAQWDLAVPHWNITKQKQIMGRMCVSYFLSSTIWRWTKSTSLTWRTASERWRHRGWPPQSDKGYFWNGRGYLELLIPSWSVKCWRGQVIHSFKHINVEYMFMLQRCLIGIVFLSLNRALKWLKLTQILQDKQWLYYPWTDVSFNP